MKSLRVESYEEESPLGAFIYISLFKSALILWVFNQVSFYTTFFTILKFILAGNWFSKPVQILGTNLKQNHLKI